MVVGAFPAIKLGFLAFRQVSGRISNAIKNRAKNHPFVRKYICLPPAQLYSKIEIKIRMIGMNLTRDTIPRLNEAQAAELGAGLLAETIIYMIGAGIIVFDYRRQSEKEAVLKQIELDEKRKTRFLINDLISTFERNQENIQHMQHIVDELSSR